jgi:hypothetical protein
MFKLEYRAIKEVLDSPEAVDGRVGATRAMSTAGAR